MTPHYEIYQWYADSIRPGDLRISVRQPYVMKLGQMMALDLDELQSGSQSTILNTVSVDAIISLKGRKTDRIIGYQHNMPTYRRTRIHRIWG